MKQKHLFLLPSMLIILSFSIHFNELKETWSTEPIMENPESVLYYPDSDQLFVANISGESAEKDGNGFISTLSTKGETINHKWVTGLNGPKGMAANKNTLYVSDIDALVIIDIAQAKVVKTIKFPEAKFLNDVTITKDGIVFVSDMNAKLILKLENDQLVTWLEGDYLDYVNGLFAEGDFLLAGTSSQLIKIDLNTKEHTVLFDKTVGIDGIEADHEGGYFFSSWVGELYHANPGEEPQLILDTKAQKINCADIGYDFNNKQILVPTFFDNRVVAYQYN